jgi:hypothetical protein
MHRARIVVAALGTSHETLALVVQVIEARHDCQQGEPLWGQCQCEPAAFTAQRFENAGLAESVQDLAQVVPRYLQGCG